MPNPKKTTNEPFVMLTHALLSSTLEPSEKLFIAYVLGWQNDGKVCFLPTSALETVLHICPATITKMIRKLCEMNILNKKNSRTLNNYGAYHNYRELTINEDALTAFLQQDAIDRKAALIEKKNKKTKANKKNQNVQTLAVSLSVVKDETIDCVSVSDDVFGKDFDCSSIPTLKKDAPPPQTTVDQTGKKIQLESIPVSWTKEKVFEMCQKWEREITNQEEVPNMTPDEIFKKMDVIYYERCKPSLDFDTHLNVHNWVVMYRNEILRPNAYKTAV